MLQGIEWPTIVVGLAIFFSTVGLSIKGWKDEAKKSPEQPEEAKVLSAAIQDTASIRANTEALRENTEELRHIAAGLTRLTDMVILMSRRP